VIFVKTLDAFTQFSVIEFFVTRTLSVSPTDHCFTAVATSLCVIFKQLADDRLTNNDSSSHVKNANKLLIKFDCCSLFYSPIGSVFIKQQKLYSNATWCLELIFDLEAECCDGEGRSKPSIDDFRSIWQRDSFTANFGFWGGFNLLAALGITVWLATWVRQLYQGNCLQGKNPRQFPASDL